MILEVELGNSAPWSWHSVYLTVINDNFKKVFPIYENPALATSLFSLHLHSSQSLTSYIHQYLYKGYSNNK